MAIAKEIMNLFKRNAWWKVPMSQVHDEGQKPVPTKPMFKIKDKQDGTKHYKVWIVTKGFLMISRVDYTKSFSPVTMEVGVRMVIGISLHYINDNICKKTREKHWWMLKVYNVEAAFLNASPGSKMYIQIPDEMVELGFVTWEEQGLFAILLDQNMYSNIDAHSTSSKNTVES